MRLDPEAIHARIAKLIRHRRRFVVATILEVKGSAPQKAGARMIVHPDGTFEFTIGGGTFEAEVIRDSLSAMDATAPSQRQYKLTKSDLGMYCQGLVQVLFETYQPRARLMIFGGGHVGQALSKLATGTELFSVVVIDDREEYADRAKHRGSKVIFTDRTFTRGVPPVDDNTYVIIVTRCHATDKLLVHRYIRQRTAYLGLIGSEAKIRQFRRELSEENVPSNLFDTIHAPIGLPIGGKNPAEVAISILAEIVQVKNDRAKASSIPAIEIKDRRL